MSLVGFEIHDVESNKGSSPNFAGNIRRISVNQLLSFSP